MLTERQLRNPMLFDKVVSADTAASLIEDGMTLGISGFAISGYPKAVTLALAEQVKNGRDIKVNITSGASVGIEIEEALAACNAVGTRFPYYASSNKSMKERINKGEIDYFDMHLSHCGQQINYGFLGDIDICIVECIAITEEGNLILTTGIGNTPIMVKEAKQVIVELNTHQPVGLEGVHDIYIQDLPPNRREIPIYKVDDRIGTTYVECGLDKIKYIVETDISDKLSPLPPPDEKSKVIAKNLTDFFLKEIESGRLSKSLLPLQSGVGAIANAVFLGFLDSPFEDLVMYSEILQDSVFDLIDAGKVKFASASSFTSNPEILERVRKDVDRYKKHMILRPLDITNHPEISRRLGVISLNTALEIDIYGHENSTHINGTHIVNGIGGSGDFTRNAYISVFLTNSTAKNDEFSRIVPMVSHVDSTEHDTMLVVTEWGYADLRCKGPRERSRLLINNCAHPKFREQLMDYVERAEKEVGGHEPHILEEALSWQVNGMKYGTMDANKIKKIKEENKNG